MKIPIPILFAICITGCISSHRDQGMDGDRNDKTNTEVNDFNELVISDFSKDSKLGGWEVEDDVVMGGRSEGAFAINQEGYAVFSGNISLENNGGFSSVQYDFDTIDVTQYSTAFIRLKGDEKLYQFIVAAAPTDPHYYVYEFQTGNDWQTVDIPLAEMYPAYRGERLDIPNYPGLTMAQIRFLIASKNPGTFSLEIGKIWLE
jgi:NADH dehydrogenase [ubiquinone] 1 alpha subcomplex assembly factor 1